MDRTVDALNVLVICKDPAVLTRLTSVLPAPDYAMSTASDTDQARGMTEDTAFGMILIEFPGAAMPVPDFLKTIRWSGSPCRQALIIVLTNDEHLEEAEELLEAGVSRVISARSNEARLKAVFDEVGSADFRFSVHAFVRIPGKELGLTGTVMTQTNDVSKSGMLVRLTKEVTMGSRFSFSLTPPGMPKPLEGTAEVVRVITSFGDRVTGFASTFVSFERDGQNLLNNFLATQKKPST